MILFILLALAVALLVLVIVGRLDAVTGVLLILVLVAAAYLINKSGG